MKQLDYIKIKVENIEKFNSQYLIDHPTIKNRFKLKSISLPNGQKLHGDNIDVYYKNNNVFISTSIPYLLYGHNYTEVNINDVYILFKYLSEVLSIDIFNGKVIDFEVAILFNSSLEFKNLIKTISGVSGLELQKKTTSFIAYGKGNTQLKVYNIYRNLKSKVSKSVFDSINGLRTNCLKIELKLIKDKRYTVEQLLEFGISENLEVLNDLIENKINYSECDYDGTKFDDILYRALLKTNKYTYKNADEIVLDIIDTLPISYSQKTARRKSLREKQLKTKLAGKTNFKDLLTIDSCDDLPF